MSQNCFNLLDYVFLLEVHFLYTFWWFVQLLIHTLFNRFYDLNTVQKIQSPLRPVNQNMQSPFCGVRLYALILFCCCSLA